MVEITLFFHPTLRVNFSFTFLLHTVLFLKAEECPETELEGWPDPVWTDSELLRTHCKEREWRRREREIGGVYLSRWRSASLPSCPPAPPHVFWGRELWLKHIAAPHSGWAPNKWGGVEAQKECRREREREANGGWREEILKKGCQNNENKWRWSLLRWRGELHLWGIFAGILLRHSKSSV